MIVAPAGAGAVLAAAARPPADGLALTAVAYGVVLTLWTLVSTVRGEALRPVQNAGAVVLGLAGAGLALAYLASLARGHRPPSVGTSVGYILAALLLLPLAWPKPGSAGLSNPRMAAGSACIASLALTVVVLRLRVTW